MTTTNGNGHIVSGKEEEEEEIPIIDYSLLVSDNAEVRSKVIQEIGEACRDWGIFMVIKHSLPEKLLKDLVDGSKSFFNLPEEEKEEYGQKQLMDPISYKKSPNSYMWREYLKLYAHPIFNAPQKPSGFREILREYTKKTRELTKELLKAISITLGLDENYICRAMDTEKGSQLLAINGYPPCPQPETTSGIPPHSDHGLLTTLVQNEMCGLQVLHEGKWVTVNPLPNAVLVNTADQLEILSNGRYKGVVHRANVNSAATRISIATAHGPSFDAIVGPAPELVDQTHPAAYRAMVYKESYEMKYRERNTCASLYGI